MEVELFLDAKISLEMDFSSKKIFCVAKVTILHKN